MFDKVPESSSIFDEIVTLPLNPKRLLVDESPSSPLWQAIKMMATPLEYLVFTINMVLLSDSYFSFDSLQRAANLLNAPETLHALDLMQNLQLIILIFFAMKLSLTASRVINFDL